MQLWEFEITWGDVLYWEGVVSEFDKTQIASGANTNLQEQTNSKSWDHLSFNCRVWHQQFKSWHINSYVLVSWHCRHQHHKKSLYFCHWQLTSQHPRCWKSFVMSLHSTDTDLHRHWSNQLKDLGWTSIIGFRSLFLIEPKQSISCQILQSSTFCQQRAAYYLFRFFLR